MIYREVLNERVSNHIFLDTPNFFYFRLHYKDKSLFLCNINHNKITWLLLLIYNTSIF